MFGTLDARRTVLDSAGDQAVIARRFSRLDPTADLVIVYNASLLSRADLVGTQSWFRGPDPNFVQVPQQVCGVLIHAVGARPFEFILAVAPREKANAEGTGAAGGEEIPDAEIGRAHV